MKARMSQIVTAKERKKRKSEFLYGERSDFWWFRSDEFDVDDRNRIDSEM